MYKPKDIPPVEAVPANHARRLFIGGILISVTYVVGLCLYSIGVWGAMLAMKPDEFATFLSGIFAPLAFLWLVLGFRQQGDELQNSARALWLQGEELRNSVEQQRQLVEVSREQLASEMANRVRIEDDAERAAQPQLMMLPGGGSYSGEQRSLRLVAVSSGPTCSAVEMLVDRKLVAETTILAEAGRIETSMEYASPAEVEALTVAVEYTDLRGNRRRQSFHVPVAETGGAYGDRTLGNPSKIGGIEKI